MGGEIRIDRRRQSAGSKPQAPAIPKKKALTWHSTYGPITVLEQRLRSGRRGAQVRAFCEQAQIRSREYSRPLQRAVTDFGADHSFAKAAQKMREHYGIELPASGARSCTLAHAKASGALQHQAPQRAVATLVTEMDGTMLPIVTTKTSPDLDGRKGKELSWREARLCLARDLEAVDGVYGATFGTVQIAGLLWRQVAEAAGLGLNTRVHGLGDGAKWIVNTFQEQFGTGPDSRATYTVDFHHVSDYLVAAAQVVAPTDNKPWLHQQQECLKQNRVNQVLGVLAPHREPEPQEEAPVRTAHKYIDERQQHLDYAGAIAAGLPIGSGRWRGATGMCCNNGSKLPALGGWSVTPSACSNSEQSAPTGIGTNTGQKPLRTDRHF